MKTAAKPAGPPLPPGFTASHALPNAVKGPVTKDKRDHQGQGDADEKEPKLKRPARAAPEAVDPSFRQMAALAPPMQTTVQPTTAADTPRARMSMEELLPSLVQKIAWAGDKNRGTVRLELGAGRFAGTTLVVHADGPKVRVEVSGTDADALRPLLQERLRRSGVDVESVT